MKKALPARLVVGELLQRQGSPGDVLCEGLSGMVVAAVEAHGVNAREVIAQGGSFGEHRFTQVRYETLRACRERLEPSPHWTEAQYREQVQRNSEKLMVTVNRRCFRVRQEAGAHVRLDLGMERFMNRPRYLFP